MRASDHDRERTAAELRAHCVAGRISFDELDARLERAMGATTVEELAELVKDLPGDEPAAPSTALHPPKPGPPGVLPFTYSTSLPAPSATVRARLLDKIAPRLNFLDYELVSNKPDEVVFERTVRPVWTVLVAILAFPVGLVALLHKTTERITFSLQPDGEKRTVLSVHGSAPRRVRKALARLTV